MFKLFHKSPKLQVIDIHGTISVSSKKYSHFNVISSLRDSMKNDDIKGVLLRINSPGGSAGASMELAMVIEKVAKVKPVVVHISDMGCSGALLAAVAATKIVASPMALIGSIGVLMSIPDIQEIADKLGVKMRVIKSGNMKDIGSPFRDLTSQEQQFLQHSITATHEQFMKYVQTKRNIIDIEDISDGRFFNAPEAYALNLIDKLGDICDAMDYLIHLCKLTDQVKWLYPKQDLMEKVISKMSLITPDWITSKMMYT